MSKYDHLGPATYCQGSPRERAKFEQIDQEYKAAFAVLDNPEPELIRRAKCAQSEQIAQGGTITKDDGVISYNGSTWYRWEYRTVTGERYTYTISVSGNWHWQRANVEMAIREASVRKWYDADSGRKERLQSYVESYIEPIHTTRMK